MRLTVNQEMQVNEETNHQTENKSLYSLAMSKTAEGVANCIKYFFKSNNLACSSPVPSELEM